MTQLLPTTRPNAVPCRTFLLVIVPHWLRRSHTSVPERPTPETAFSQA